MTALTRFLILLPIMLAISDRYLLLLGLGFIDQSTAACLCHTTHQNMAWNSKKLTLQILFILLHLVQSKISLCSQSFILIFIFIKSKCISLNYLAHLWLLFWFVTSQQVFWEASFKNLWFWINDTKEIFWNIILLIFYRSSPRHSPHHTPKSSPPVGKKLVLDSSQRPVKQQTYDNSSSNTTGWICTYLSLWQ